MKPRRDHADASKSRGLGGIPRLALRPSEAAQALGVSERTLRTWVTHEGLPVARVGGAVLIPTAELRSWLADRVTTERRTEALVAEMLCKLG